MAYLEVCRLKQYYILLDKLKIHCVKEHILSFITGINGTINTQIVKYKTNIHKAWCRKFFCLDEFPKENESYETYMDGFILSWRKI